ncbi:MAG: hypothetical protein A2511_14520 [Deltaproteobacteria bacterium RIFOXYD12_FULL_50_9]|nr:MAG: hypothetical protein A2511_14520 [Deltaproteobacteria bacterium RIFOXYD12_FULL_50_9]
MIWTPFVIVVTEYLEKKFQFFLICLNHYAIGLGLRHLVRFSLRATVIIYLRKNNGKEFPSGVMLFSFFPRGDTCH